MGSFLPYKDGALLLWAENASSKINLAAASYGVPTAVATAFVAKTTAFATAMAANEPGVRNQMTVATKNAARAALRSAASYVSKLVQGTASVTDAMKYDVGLNVKRAPSPRPVPSTSPVLVVKGVSRNTVLVDLRDADNDTKRGLPAGVSAATVFSHVGTTPPASAEGWKFESSTTKTTFEIAFDEALPTGTKVFLCAFWANSRMESGPACNPVEATLVGGAALPRAEEAFRQAA